MSTIDEDRVENELEEALEPKANEKKRATSSKGISKKRSTPRPPARPHRKMSDEQLNYNMIVIKERMDLTDSRFKALNVRYSKLARESEYRKAQPS